MSLDAHHAASWQAWQPQLQRITPTQPWALHDSAATRLLETHALTATPPMTLMRRAGVAVARLAWALQPHAQTFWVFCGTGNNGGDGWVAAHWLHQRGARVAVICPEPSTHLPPDAMEARTQALAAGVPLRAVCDAPTPIPATDLCIDALMGLGPSASPWRPPSPWMASALYALRAAAAPILHVDLPSGLHPDTGMWAQGWAPTPSWTMSRPPAYTLSLLTLHPGLFTAHGRDAAGSVWLDDLQVRSLPLPETAVLPPIAHLTGARPHRTRAHSSHKGSWGDVAILGGESWALRGMGMQGAALLAARSALHAGAGRVLIAWPDETAPGLDSAQPDVMVRTPQTLEWERCTVVFGCGGGEAVQPWLLPALERSQYLVLDADALNALARQPLAQRALVQRNASHPGERTILTPHPLEAARLLETDTTSVQSDRLQAAQTLAQRFLCTVVLKGSGTVIAAPQQTPWINPTGNARLGIAGTGDVLAGWIGAYWAQGLSALEAARDAVYAHGTAADQWPSSQPLTASLLAQQASAA